MARLNTSGLERLWTHILAKLGGKVDVVSGKGLSTNDYTNEDKEKLTNLSTEGLASETYVDEAISNLVNSAPETLNTLGELAVAMQENASVVAALNAAVTNKVDKVDGKGLSTNDYTNEDKNTLETLNTFVGDTSVANQLATAINAIEHPVTSVNGQTGDVEIEISANVDVDTTLAVEGAAADAKATGDAIATATTAMTNEEIDAICGQSLDEVLATFFTNASGVSF